MTLLPVLILPVVLVDKVLYRIPAPWSWLTIIIQAAALVLLVVGVSQTGAMSFLGFRQLLTGTDEPASRLVVDGLYRYVRHPLYFAGLVIIWLMPVMSCNLLALNIGLTLYILIGAFFEERKMLQDFGETYADYRRRTPMLIPGFRLRNNCYAASVVIAGISRGYCPCQRCSAASLVLGLPGGWNALGVGDHPLAYPHPNDKAGA